MGVQGANGPDRIIRTTYDLAGQALTTVQGLGTPDLRTYATYTYSANGKQVAVADARNNLSTMVYDGFDRLCRLVFPISTAKYFSVHTPPVGCRTNPTLASPDTVTQGDFEEFRYDAAGNRS